MSSHYRRVSTLRCLGARDLRNQIHSCCRCECLIRAIRWSWSSRNFTLGLVAISCLLLPSVVRGQTRTWTASSPGSFLAGSNWSGGVVPDSVGQTVIISDQPANGGDFTLNGSQTIGDLHYYNSQLRYLNGTGTLTFQALSGQNALYEMKNGGMGIGVASVVLASTTEFNSIGLPIDITSQISGSGGVSVIRGALRLFNANNSYLGLNVINGAINGASLTGSTIADAGSNSSFGQGNFSISNSGFLQYDGATSSSNRTISLDGGYGWVRVSQPSTTLSLAGVISGAGNFAFSGPGAVQLNASNTYGGTTEVWSGGTLQLGASERIPDASAVSVSLGSTLDLNHFSETIGSLSGNGSIQLGSGELITGGNNLPSQFFGSISGSGGLTKVGSGGLTLSGLSSYLGPTTITGGSVAGSTIADAGSNSAFGRGDFVLTGGGRLEYTGDSASTNRTFTLNSGGTISVGFLATTLKVTGLIGGTGTLGKVGAGTLELTAGNNYTGSTFIGLGTLRLGASEVIPNTSAVTVLGTLDLNSFNETVASISGDGRIVLGSGRLTTGQNNLASSFIGNISGTGGLTKTGSGTLTLSGNNAYTGQTVVQAGRLVVTTNLAASDASSVLVNLDPDGNFVNGAPTIERRVAGGQGYTGLGSQSAGPGALATQAELRLGVNAFGGDDSVTMAWRARTSDETPASEGGHPQSPPLGIGGDGLYSDVLNLGGLVADRFVLQMSYDEAMLPPLVDPVLAWLNPNGASPGVAQWEVATLSNQLVGASAVMNFVGSWDTFAAHYGVNNSNLSTFLGSWGHDPNGHRVWAVLDHVGQFAVVPEPSTLALGGFAFTALLIAVRTRKHGKRAAPAQCEYCRGELVAP